MELLFAAFFTTASASTSLLLLLLQHPAAIAKIRQELAAQGLGRACSCEPGSVGEGAGPWPDCRCEPDLNLAALGGLRYVDCVVKEVLRLLPPVSGGYRTALRTFELDVSALHPAPCRPAACCGAWAGGGGCLRRPSLLFFSWILHFPTCKMGSALFCFPRSMVEGPKPSSW